jgi:mycothiol synthase
VSELVRPYRDGDATELAELFNAADASYGGEPRYTAAKVRGFMTGLVHDVTTDTRMMFDPDGSLIANATVPTPPDGADRVRVFGAVRPDRRGQSLGSDLLAWQMVRLTAIHDRLAPGRPWQAGVGCDTRDIRSVRLYEGHGFTPVRYWSEMAMPTNAAPAEVRAGAQLADGLRSVPYRPEILATFYEAYAEAFADHWGFVRRDVASWAALTVESPEFRADLSRVAYDGDEIAGYVLSADAIDDGTLIIKNVGTRQRWRGRGIASALIIEVLRAAAATGKRTAELSVDTQNPTGAAGLYGRIGFVETASETSFAKVVPAL